MQCTTLTPHQPSIVLLSPHLKFLSQFLPSLQWVLDDLPIQVAADSLCTHTGSMFSWSLLGLTDSACAVLHSCLQVYHTCAGSTHSYTILTLFTTFVFDSRRDFIPSFPGFWSSFTVIPELVELVMFSSSDPLQINTSSQDGSTGWLHKCWCHLFLAWSQAFCCGSRVLLCLWKFRRLSLG